MKIIFPIYALCFVFTLQVSSQLLALANATELPMIPRAVRVKPPASTLNEVVGAASQKHHVPKAVIHSVIAAESAYHQDAVSNKGAIGLMQLMPATAEELGADP